MVADGYNGDYGIGLLESVLSMDFKCVTVRWGAVQKSVVCTDYPPGWHSLACDVSAY